MAKVRIGFVGVGAMGQAAHLRNYIALPDCEVVALAEIRPKLGRAVADRYGIRKVYVDHRDMLAAEALDGIVAIQQFQTHADLVPELLAKGLPVLIEKPLADSVERGAALLSAVRLAGVPLYLAYHKRSDPATAYAKAKIDLWKANGELGALRYVRITMPPGDWMRNGFAWNVSTDESYNAESASGEFVAFVNYYIHQVNLIRFLLGEDYEVVFSDPGGVTLAIRSESGVSGILEMAPYRTTRDWQESALIAFEKGWIRLELPSPLAINEPGKVTLFEDRGESFEPLQYSPTVPLHHAMLTQAENFLHAIRGEPHSLATAEDGAKDLQTAARYMALRSAAT